MFWWNQLWWEICDNSFLKLFFSKKTLMKFLKRSELKPALSMSSHHFYLIMSICYGFICLLSSGIAESEANQMGRRWREKMSRELQKKI